MSYTSLSYGVFVAAVVVLYYLLPLRFRWFALLAGSIAFYGMLCPYGLPFVLGAGIIAWAGGIALSKASGGRKVLSVVLRVLVLLPLPVVRLLRGADLGLIVPVGLSFYSLALYAYLADVTAEKIDAEKNPLVFLLFTMFFPQIVQGPIPRYGALAPQLREGHKFDPDGITRGLQLVLWGLFLKLVIAERVSTVVDVLFGSPAAYPGAYVLAAGVLYCVELYTDFYACVTLSQGVAQLFGIRLEDNFRRPWLSLSVKEFWTRWHMSLSFWLRDYVYIPLGGSRCGTVRKYVNLLLTFAVSGLWHGFSLKYLVWGVLQAVFQLFEGIGRRFTTQGGTHSNKVSVPLSAPSALLHRLITAFLLMVGFVIFRADTLGQGLTMLANMVTVWNPWVLTDGSLLQLGLSAKQWFVTGVSVAVLLGVSLRQERGVCLRDEIAGWPVWARWILYLAAVTAIVLLGAYGPGYDAQAFIYGGF